jgi:hypothetical protein
VLSDQGAVFTEADLEDRLPKTVDEFRVGGRGIDPFAASETMY